MSRFSTIFEAMDSYVEHQRAGYLVTTLSEMPATMSAHMMNAFLAGACEAARLIRDGGESAEAVITAVKDAATRADERKHELLSADTDTDLHALQREILHPAPEKKPSDG